MAEVCPEPTIGNQREGIGIEIVGAGCFGGYPREAPAPFSRTNMVPQVESFDGAGVDGRNCCRCVGVGFADLISDAKIPEFARIA